MTSFWKQPKSSLRQQELSWLNSVHQTHDLWCHCEDVNLHLIRAINKFSGYVKPEKDIRNIKCLITGPPFTPTEEEDTTTKEEDGFDEGELERLFAETDTQEENSENQR